MCFKVDLVRWKHFCYFEYKYDFALMLPMTFDTFWVNDLWMNEIMKKKRHSTWCSMSIAHEILISNDIDETNAKQILRINSNLFVQCWNFCQNLKKCVIANRGSKTRIWWYEIKRRKYFTKLLINGRNEFSLEKHGIVMCWIIHAKNIFEMRNVKFSF